MQKLIRQCKAKLMYKCPGCEHIRMITTYPNQKTIEIKKIYCLDCKIEMRAFLTNSIGERIL